MIQTFLENASSNQEIIDLITETSGRHTQRGLLRRNNDERPPSRVNSQPNVVCIDDDIVEIIAACIVMHARAAAQDGYVPSQEYAIFTKEMTQSHYDVDCSLENVKYVINVIRNETRMEYEYLIIGYIYLERMCKLTDYKFRICCRNWRYSLFSTLMLASKTWDDFALTNYHYSNIFCNLNLWRINKLEVELLLMLNFSIGVSSDEFHQYYDAIHQLITASNVRRIQNKLERYVIQTSATLNTTSSVSYSPTTSLHSPRYRDVPSLSLSPMSSDHYELSRVGGMCVLIEKESSYSSSRSKLESEREKASCDSGSLDGSGKVSFGPLISQHPKLLKGPAYSSKVLPMTSDQEYHPSSCSSTLRDLKHDSATTLLSVKLKPMPEPRKDHAESSEPYLKATLTGIKSFFIKLFSASDSNLSEEAKIDHQYPSERIQLARTFTHSEFSTSHRVLSGKSLSSRNSSWRTTRTKHLSEVQ